MLFRSGEVVEYDIFESVIKSKIQMTYKKVNALLEDNVVAEGYEPYVEKLNLMKELAEILRANKVRKGVETSRSSVPGCSQMLDTPKSPSKMVSRVTWLSSLS